MIYSNKLIHKDSLKDNDGGNRRMKDIIICRCEEITKGEIEEAIDNGASTPDEVKRFTRAGMGLCQGRTCRKSVEGLISKNTGMNPHNVKPSTYRQPVRTVKMKAFENQEE